MDQRAQRFWPLPSEPLLSQGDHMTTNTRIVCVGNSRGIRVPRLLREQADLRHEVELHAEPGRLIVRAAVRPRAGWAAKARAMHEHDDDQMLDDVTATHFDAWE